MTLTLLSFLKKKNLFQAPVLVKRDVLLLFSTSSSELEELVLLIVPHVFMCFFLSFSSACCLGIGFLVVSTNGQRPGDPGDSTLPSHHR